MEVWLGLVALWSALRRRCGGFWSYMAVRAHGKTLVALERERNRGTIMALRALPDGAELAEGDPSGYRRVIAMPAQQPRYRVDPPIPPQATGTGRDGNFRNAEDAGRADADFGDSPETLPPAREHG